MSEQKVALSANEAFCRSCGDVIKSAAEICPKCGVRQASASDNKNYVVLVLLSFFLGHLGVDRFYAGQTGMGLLKLFVLFPMYVISMFLMVILIGFFTILIPIAWWLIDFIIAVCGKMKDNKGNYITNK